MKRLYSITLSLFLIISMAVSFSGCALLNGLLKNDEDSSASVPNENGGNTDGAGSENGDGTVILPPVDVEPDGITPDNPGNTEPPKDEGGDGTVILPPVDVDPDYTTPDHPGNTEPPKDEGGDNTEGGSTEGEGGGTDSDTDGNEGNDPNASKPNTTETAELPHVSYSNIGENAYNKELFYKNSYEIPLGDPTVLVREENGVIWYYVTGTTTGSSFEMWKTKNFTDWIKIGTVYSPPENFFGESSFWAPQLIYDGEADRRYYLGDEASEGKGLYILFFSARRSNNVCALSVAFSENIEGPYRNFVGVNANGDYIDETNSCFEIEKLRGLGLYKNHVYGDLYKAKRSFIDASPFVDTLTGEKYLYMVRSRNVDASNDVWGVRMKDWVSPDYKTTTPLTSYGYTDINKTEPYGYLAADTNKIDEGPFMYYKDATDDGIDNGLYYLTFSIGGTNDKLYPVCQATGASPLGPFTKIQPEKGGLLNVPEMHWDIHGSGHHAFFEVGGELYVAYHTYTVNSDGSFIRRFFAFDKVIWIYNAEGQYIMRSNGPTKSINPLPSASSGYTNLAKDAAITLNGYADPDTALLTDGFIATRNGEEDFLFTYSFDTVLTLTFDDYVKIRAIMLYNSFDFSNAFAKIDKIELSYREEYEGRYYLGTAVINALSFNFSNHMIPKSYLESMGESNMLKLRPGGSAITEFNEIEVSSIKIYLKNYNADTFSALSEIIVLGKPSDTVVSDESLYYGGYEKKADFDSYTAFPGYMEKEETDPEDLVKIDGILDEEVWTSLATVITINGAKTDNETKLPVDISLYGERSANVYVYVGKRKLYFAFDVKDKNLFFNPNMPQGRSTCVEIYFTTAENTSLTEGCYSIRINPTAEAGELSCNLGIYVPNDQGNEWRKISLLNVVKCAALVDGHVGTSAYDSNYNSENNVGYTVEIAIDKILLGLNESSLRFTAAFVQDRGYNDPRIANTFIEGTNYVKPETWIVFSNKESEAE